MISNKSSLASAAREDLEQCGDVNQTMLAINVRAGVEKQGGREVSAAFINCNERSMLISSFIDNEHLSFLESFIIQLNNSNHDSKFEVIIHMPQQSVDPVLYDKLHDLLALCAVQYQTTVGTNATAGGRGSSKSRTSRADLSRKDFDHRPNVLNSQLEALLKNKYQFKIEDATMSAALGCLGAAINSLNLVSGGLT